MLQDGMPEEQEAMLASRALEEAGERVVLVAVDQRGSKPLERLLRKADPEVFGKTFATLMQALPEIAPNQYGSHVLESSISSWTGRLGSEVEASRPSLEPVLKLCRSLKQDGGWPPLIDDSCATHVVRALVLALGGYVSTPQDKGKANARSGFLPERKVDVPPEVAACRRELASEVVGLLRGDDSLCLSAQASPVVQLLLRVLRDRGDRAFVADACAAIVGATSPAAKLSKERLDALANSAPGSRVLEAVLQTASAEVVSSLFAGYFRQKLRALSRGEAGEFGAYLAHRVADGLVDEPQLASALAEVDFAACLSLKAPAPQQAIVPKFLEACLRLRARLKEAASQVFRVFGLHESKTHHRVWPTLLALEDVGGPEGLLRQRGERRGRQAEEGKGEEGEEAAAGAEAKLRPLPSVGSQIIATLMRFPAEAVQPLNSGLPKLCEHRELLGVLAREARTARVLEAALKPTSAVVPKLRLRLTRAFKGMLGALGPHPVGGWVCVAAWRCSLGDTALRQAFVEELLAVEDALRADNFAVWKVCGLNQAKIRGEEWEKQQGKASKTQRLFGELLEGGDPEAAKAAAEARRRADEEAADREARVLADPLVAGLLPAPAVEEMEGVEALEAAAADAEEPEDPALGKGKRGKKRKGKKASAPEKASETAPEPSAKGGAAPGGDAYLKEALQLIAGGTGSRAARKRRKAKAEADAAEGGDPGKKKRKLAFS